MYIHVHVTPGAKKESLTKKSDTEFDILVKEPKERNLANRRVSVMLARALQVPESQVRMLTGHRSQSKLFSVEL